MRYEKMFEPITINGMRLKNRIVLGPCAGGYANTRHAPTTRMAAYYAERAKGGASLVIVEHTMVQLAGVKSGHNAGLWDEEALPAWKSLVDSVHGQGAKVAVEIGHLGRCTDYGDVTGLPAVAPSAVPCHLVQRMPREMTPDAVEQFKSDYAKGVAMALAAGFDAVELHLTNGYFLAQWLSGRANKRSDAYGGTLEGRLRLPLEIVALARAVVGKDYPLLARLGVRENMSGRGVEETRVIAAALEDAGIDALDLNSGSFSDYDEEFPSYYRQQGFLLDDIERVKRSVRIPVMAGGRITEPRMAEQVLREGRADIVQINRGMVADPYWVNKVAGGEMDMIMRCVGCTRCIAMKEPDGMTCSVNPFAGREETLVVRRAESGKKVLVAGGGPAGLQAAHTAALRGHAVTLAEKESKLGGLANAAAVPPMKWETAGLVATLAKRVAAAGVTILPGTEVDEAFIRRGGFDAVLVATGSRPAAPPFPVPPDAVTAVAVLRGEAWPGNRVAILGGGMVGCECADFLAEYGKAVTIFEMREAVAFDLHHGARIGLLGALRRGGVEMVTGARITAATRSEVLYERDGAAGKSGGFDTIVLAAGMTAHDPLSGACAAAGVTAVVIGDARAPGCFHDALASAVEAAITL